MGLVLAAPLRLPAAVRPLRVRLPGWLAARLTAALVAVWRITWPHVVLAGAAALLLYPVLADGALRWQDDNKYFYYPLLSQLAAGLREGRLPLWEPGVFGGYPLFGDGEAGMLYPPNVVLFRFLEPATALVWLRLSRFYLAGAFTFAYLRSVGCTRVAALTGGVAFMWSGFVVGQVIAENLASGMVWLPLALYFVERSVRSAGWSRYGLASFAGVALAMQALAVHVQICVFTVLAVFPYLGWRVLWKTTEQSRSESAGRQGVGTAHLMDRMGIGLGLGATVGLTGFGLAAVQMLPLLDVAERSARGHGIGLSAATINSVTPFRLLTVAFPELLRRQPDGFPFGYWVDWEVTVYVGVPALLFALVAVALRRDALSVFFAALAGASLMLSMGRYGPPWVVAVTRDLLGDHGLRSPGRFAYLWTFGVAALAGLGVDWLMRLGARAQPGWRAGLGRIWLGVAGGVVAGGLAGLLVTAQAARFWLAAHPEEAVAWLERQFMAYDRTVRLRITPPEAYASLLQVLDPAHTPMRVWVLSVVGSYAVFVGWCVLRGTRAGTARLVSWWVLSVATVALVAAPLYSAATRIHPTERLVSFESDSPATLFLRDQLAPPGVPAQTRPLERVYSGQAVFLGRSDVEPNALLGLGIQEAGGYSSLSSERHMAYAWAAELSAGRMMDVWNARYVIAPNQPHMLPSHELTAFHPERQLLSGGGANSGARGWFRVPSVESENVRVVSTLRDAWGAKPGDVAGWVVAEDDQGGRHVWPLRVGMEVAEATLADPSMRDQRPPELASTPVAPLPVHEGFEFAADGKKYPVRLYYAKLPLKANARVVRLGVQAVPMANAPLAILRVNGLGVGQPDWEVHNVSWPDRERYTEVFADEEVVVYRNETVLPRAYLLPLAATLPQELHVKQLAERAFDPERIVLIDPAGTQPPGPVEDSAAGSWFTPPAAGAVDAVPTVAAADHTGHASVSPAGETRIVEYRGDLVRIEANAVQDGWLFLSDAWDPNWRAYLDGRETRIYLANGMFRAVAVPAGAHRLEFRYQPLPLERGAALSFITGLVVLAGIAVGVTTGLVRRLRGASRGG